MPSLHCLHITVYIVQRILHSVQYILHNVSVFYCGWILAFSPGFCGGCFSVVNNVSLSIPAEIADIQMCFFWINPAGSFPGRPMVKNPPANARDIGSIPGSGRSTGGGHGNPLQYSCLENPMGIGAWRASVHGVPESDQTEQQQQAVRRHVQICPHRSPESSALL